jgi:ligand-binding sensor domain-containing protein
MYSAPSYFPTNWKINTMVEFDNSYLIGTDNGIYQIPYTLDSITKLSAQPYKINQMKVSTYDPLFPGLFIASSAGWGFLENLSELVDDLVLFDPFAAAPNEEVNSISFDPDEDFVALGNPTKGLKIYDTNSDTTSTFDISPTMFSDEINDITYAEGLDNDSMTYIRTFMIATNNTLHQIDVDNMTIFKNTGNDQVNSVFSYIPISTPGIIKNVFTDGTTITIFEDAIYNSVSPFQVNGQQDITSASFGSPAVVNKVWFDSDDVLHLGHSLGYSIQTSTSAPFINYSVESGLPNNNVKTIMRNGDDKILIGTDAGLCISNDVISVMALD